ncbi:MAG: cytochrome c maturation protein CcmE [Saprospiraceae bacterium]
MRRNTILALILVVIGIVVIISSSKDVSTYAKIESAENGDLVKIAGKLSKDKPIVFDAEKNPNLFSFFMYDDEGKEMKVHVYKPKPQDFEMSEQIVVTGRMQDGIFQASDILLKCPSKYKNEEISIRSQNG